MKRPIFIALLISMVFLAGCAGIKTAFIMTPQLHIKYPVVEYLKDKAVREKVNKLIYSTVFKLRDENASNLKKHELDYSYYVEAKAVYDKKDLLSLKFDECLSIPFYAHPFNALYAVTIDTKTGSVLKLNDLFMPGISWEASLNGMLKRSIDERESDSEVPLIEQFKSIDKDQGFYLSNDGLVVYWQEARYFPRYLGALEVTIKYDNIRDSVRILK